MKGCYFIFLIILFKYVDANCTCVPYYQCTDDTEEVITDGKDLLDIRFKNDGPCRGYFDVCCNTVQKSVAFEFEPPSGCGYNKIESFTALVAIQDDYDSTPDYICGASLIHPQVLISSAHCLAYDVIYSVKLGNITKIIDETIFHPEYSATSLKNDISLMVVNSPFDGFSTICIPPPGMLLKNCWILGWEYMSNFPTKLVNVSVINYRSCTKQLRGTRLGASFQLPAGFVCGLGTTCNAYDGMPLVCPVAGQPGRYHQGAMLSWGVECNKNIPEIYTNLGRFRRWIDDEMTELGFDILQYRY